MDIPAQEQLSRQNIVLPAGYEFASDEHAGDFAEIINNTWPQALSSDLEHTR
jgi:hypothetical protein